MNKNAYDILADVTLNIKIYQIIFTLIRINKETNGKNKIKKNIIRNVKNLQFNFIGGKNSERQNHNFNSR